MGRKEQLMRELERTVEALVKDYKSRKDNPVRFPGCR